MRKMKSKRKKYSKAPLLPPTQLIHKHLSCRVKPPPSPSPPPHPLHSLHVPPGGIWGCCTYSCPVPPCACGPGSPSCPLQDTKMRAFRSTIIIKGVKLFQAEIPLALFKNLLQIGPSTSIPIARTRFRTLLTASPPLTTTTTEFGLVPLKVLLILKNLDERLYFLKDEGGR